MQKEIIELSHLDMIVAAVKVSTQIKNDFDELINNTDLALNIYPVPRGGIPCSYLAMGFIGGSIRLVDSAEEADIIIDDIIDSGDTRNRVLALNPNARFYAFFNSEDYPDKWLSFTYDRTLDNQDSGIDIELLRLSEHTGLEIAEIKNKLGL